MWCYHPPVMSKIIKFLYDQYNIIPIGSHHSVGYHHSNPLLWAVCALTIHPKFSIISKCLYPVVWQLISSQYNMAL